MTPRSRPKLTTDAALAEALGCSRQTVAKLKKTYGLRRQGDGYDLAEAQRLMKFSREAGKSGTSQSAEARKWDTAYRKAKAQMAQLELAKRRGELVEVAKVQQEAFATGRQVRDALLNLPDRLAAVFAAETVPHEIHVLLTKEIRQALIALKTPPDPA